MNGSRKGRRAIFTAETLLIVMEILRAIKSDQHCPYFDDIPELLDSLSAICKQRGLDDGFPDAEPDGRLTDLIDVLVWG